MSALAFAIAAASLRSSQPLYVSLKCKLNFCPRLTFVQLHTYTSYSLLLQINWHLEVMNELLDNGADVNYLTDEGVSALSATLIQYYGRVEERKRELEAKARERERIAKEHELERLRELAAAIRLKESGGASGAGSGGGDGGSEAALQGDGASGGSGDQTRAPNLGI